MPQTRHKSGGIDPAVVFPDLSNFSPPTKLPTNRSVVGVLQNVIKGSKGANQISTKDAVREVAKRVYAKYYHDTVYCMTLQGIIKKLDNIWSIFKEGRKRFNAGMKTGKAIDNYKELVDNADKLFDVGITTSDQKDQCKKSWGVAMSEAEDRYYEDQKTQRRMECDKQVDPVWYWAMMKKERMKSRQEEWSGDKSSLNTRTLRRSLICSVQVERLKQLPQMMSALNLQRRPRITFSQRRTRATTTGGSYLLMMIAVTLIYPRILLILGTVREKSEMSFI